MDMEVKWQLWAVTEGVNRPRRKTPLPPLADAILSDKRKNDYYYKTSPFQLFSCVVEIEVGALVVNGLWE